MVTLADRIKAMRAIEVSSKKYIFNSINISPSRAHGFYVNLINVPMAVRTKVGQLVAKMDGWGVGDDEYTNIVGQAEDDKFVIVDKPKKLEKLKELLKKLAPKNKIVTTAEISSVENAKQLTHDKKAKKLSETVKKLGITAGEWEKLSEKVFRLAFK